VEKEKSAKWGRAETWAVIWTLVIIIVVMICTGCGSKQADTEDVHQPFPVHQDMGDVENEKSLAEGFFYQTANEYCYKGVTYVVFPYGHASVASVMLDKNSKVVPCGQ
jgi:hypothetical protein